MTFRRRALAGVLALALGACNGGTDNSGVPSELEEVSGATDEAVAGTPLAEPLVVKVATGSGAGVEGIRLEWSVTNGGGTLQFPTTETDDDGISENGYTVGAAGGENRVRVRIAGNAEIEAVEFVITAPVAGGGGGGGGGGGQPTQ